ncbi:hypothetical protein [Paraferrimonas sedimenticola]|uniref:Uncharacterized protein n=1 Tax=Paraferrimonas sedimenticola TaxID=375674 RepID=A0AA37W0P7_9GAMM|nr:hypothetical protein [Paraferrimonas sedimenticola]GLP95292.1 hypothetical protein GCM10007895_05980 [Paraferrimonas sedimenticola]
MSKDQAQQQSSAAPTVETEEDAINAFNELTEENAGSKDPSSTEDDVNELDQPGNKDEPKASDDDTPNDPPGEEDIWAGATDAQREAFNALAQQNQQLHNDVQANAGRVSGYSRKVSELEKQLQQAQQPNAGSGEGKPEDDPNNTDPDQGDLAAQLREDFPEIAQYIDERLSPIEQQRLAQEQAQREQSEVQALLQRHPDAATFQSDPAFGNWLSQQPEFVQKAANSKLASEVSGALDLYKASSSFQSSDQKPPAQASQQSQQTKLSQHAELPRKGGARAQVADDDVDPIDYFNQITS